MNVIVEELRQLSVKEKTGITFQVVILLPSFVAVQKVLVRRDEYPGSLPSWVKQLFELLEGLVTADKKTELLSTLDNAQKLHKPYRFQICHQTCA